MHACMQAVADLEKSVEINPSDAGSYSMKAGLLKKLGGTERLEQALADYNQALKLGGVGKKGAKNNHYNRANVLMGLKRYGEAVSLVVGVDGRIFALARITHHAPMAWTAHIVLR
jgi:Flp pilus assembly protein TadD